MAGLLASPAGPASPAGRPGQPIFWFSGQPFFVLFSGQPKIAYWARIEIDRRVIEYYSGDIPEDAFDM